MSIRLTSIDMRMVVLLLCLAVARLWEGGPETAPVTGTVTLDGQPLTSGVVTFFPKVAAAPPGFIQSDGTYRLGTFSSADGALIGKHKVSVTAGGGTPGVRPDFDSDRPSAAKSAIPARYSNADGSGLEFEVKAGEDNVADFDLVSKRN